MFAKKVDKRGTWTRALVSLAFSIGLIMGIRWAFFEPYIIPSESMVPTLLVHDHIMVNKFAYGLRVPFTKKFLLKFAEPKRGDLIVFRSVEDPQIFLIKRVVGLPGDEIQHSSRSLLINGQSIEQRAASESEIAPFSLRLPLQASEVDFRIENLEGFEHIAIFHRSDSPLESLETIKVPENHVFVMGDNRDRSADSRSWGTLPIDNILGRASHIWLSCEQMAEGSSRLCNFATLRSERIFSKVR